MKSFYCEDKSIDPLVEDICRNVVQSFEETKYKVSKNLNLHIAKDIKNEEYGLPKENPGRYDHSTRTVYVTTDIFDSGAPDVFVGVLAHEIAHSIVKQGNTDIENMVNDKLNKYGFTRDTFPRGINEVVVDYILCEIGFLDQISESRRRDPNHGDEYVRILGQWENMNIYVDKMYDWLVVKYIM